MFLSLFAFCCFQTHLGRWSNKDKVKRTSVAFQSIMQDCDLKTVIKEYLNGLLR